MTITYTEAKNLIHELDPEYAERHLAHKKLRDFWHGRYWDEVDTNRHGLASIFRDVTSVKSDVGPDMKLVRNLVFDVCLKYQSFLSGLPMIRTFVDRPDSRRARTQAATKERALYGTWAQGNMNLQLNRLAWFGPLMGDSFLGIWPDVETPGVKAVVRSPEHAYPLPSFDGSSLDAILFCWKTTEGRAKRAFPSFPGKDSDEQDKNVEILEYSGDKFFRRWVDGKMTNDIQHDLGFNLFDQVPFIHVPGEPWNHGAVEQSVNLVEAGNALYSLMMQAMIENVFPRMVIEDPMKFSEIIDTGPGAVIPVNPGGDLRFVSPGGEALSVAAGILQENERSIKQGTSMPDVNFGQFDASIITGKAVNALQGAGTGSVVEMVQGAGIGVALEQWNEKALTIYQRMFADDRIYLYGMQPQSHLDINPRQFAISFKGSEIVGSPRNEVVFGPYIDMHGKLVMALQAQGAGLTSKQYGREQIGISDSEAMQEEITAEVIEEAVVGAMVQQLMAEPTEEAGDQAFAQAYGYLSGTPVVRAPLLPQAPPGAPPPGGPVQGPPSGGPQGGLPIAPLPGGGAVSAPALPLPPGSALGDQTGVPAAGVPEAPPAAPAPGGAITLPQAQQTFSQAPFTGRVWLVGEIVAQGQTDTVEVAYDTVSDREILQQAATFPVALHLTPQGPDPSEQAVEVTR